MIAYGPCIIKDYRSFMISVPFWLKALTSLEPLASFLPRIIAATMVAAEGYHAQEHDTSITNDAMITKEMGNKPCTAEHEG